ncbi:helix-turn-helix domain-containing protein [Streptomyces sp. NPDC059455]|uniref:helix-turn-helix domain-containing protein n=1 Tax=Streptomyces sp. NPDC059455 TaxID=3346837 RepID=UPI003677BAD3
MEVLARHARELLEVTDLGIERIAAQSGLGTSTNLRARFRDALGTTPSAYRRTFGSDVPERHATP